MQQQQQTYPSWFDPYHRWIMRKRREKSWAGWVCATAIMAILLAIAFAVLAGIAYSTALENQASASLTASQALPPRPFSYTLDAAGGPIQITLPNDLTDYVGNWYTLVSTTAQPHKVVIQAGILPTAWDATANQIADFGGQPRDYLTFFVATKSLVVVGPLANIVFS